MIANKVQTCTVLQRPSYHQHNLVTAENPPQAYPSSLTISPLRSQHQVTTCIAKIQTPMPGVLSSIFGICYRVPTAVLLSSRYLCSQGRPRHRIGTEDMPEP